MDAKRHHLSEGQRVWVVQDGQKTVWPLPIKISEAIPHGAAWVPSGVEATHTLGEPFGLITFIPNEDNKK